MSYKVTCTNCKKVEYHKHQTDFSTTRCNACNSLAFGLKEYRWIPENQKDTAVLDYEDNDHV